MAGPLGPPTMPLPLRIALVTATEARALDQDLPPLTDALRAEGAEVALVDWDDPTADWSLFAAAVIRCPWDYTRRREAFLAAMGQVATQTRLFNPPAVLRANTDKRYLQGLADAGVAVVPTLFLTAADDLTRLVAWLNEQHAQDCVVKPSVGAGSQDARRFAANCRAEAVAHAAGLAASGRTAMVQPYLDRVDAQGETALIFMGGAFSHAIRKGPLLRRGEVAGPALFAAETIAARQPGVDELALAEQALAAVGQPLLYARVDVLRDGDGAPRLLELELIEPSLFFAHGAGSAQRLAGLIVAAGRGQWPG